MKWRLVVLVTTFLLSNFFPAKVAYGLPICGGLGTLDWHIGTNCHTPPDPNQCNTTTQSCLNCQSVAGDLEHTPIPTGYVCVNLPPSQPIPVSVSTEIGKLNPQPNELITALVLILVGLSGGVSLFLTISGAVKYLFSSGNPEAVEDARSTIVHAAGGFILVILSVFLLRFIGIDLLHIPGFSPSSGGGVDVPYP